MRMSRSWCCDALELIGIWPAPQAITSPSLVNQRVATSRKAGRHQPVDDASKHALGSGRRWPFRLWIGVTMLLPSLPRSGPALAQHAHTGTGPLAGLIRLR
jgi:hypothetical protein